MTAAATGGLRDPATLLAAWEAAAGVPAHARGPAILDSVHAVGAANPLDLPLGTLVPLLARCYREAFGPLVEATVTCPDCGATLDVEIDPTPMCRNEDVPINSPSVIGAGRIAVRAPTPRDLLAAAGAGDAAGDIVARCATYPDGTAAQLADLAPDDLAALEAALEQLTGPGLPLLRTDCPGCGAAVTALIDLGTLLVGAVTAAASRLLAEIAELAAAYGWDEAGVLALSPRRRAAYLELAGR